MLFPTRFEIDLPELGLVQEWQQRLSNQFEPSEDGSEPEILIPVVLLWQLLIFTEAALRFPALLAEAAG